jgi:carotenoid cleavage dioxygenase-like enzyme
MKRNTNVDSIRWFEIEPSFILHAMNAWEDGETIHCEVMEYPNAPVFPNADGSPGQDAHARLTRWTIDLAGKTNRAMREQIDDLPSEMPRFDERLAGPPYRHGWYLANVGKKDQLVFNAIVHIDLKTGERKERTLDPGDAADEPIFVPRSASALEGDGFIIALVYRAATNTSELLILYAQDIAGEPAAVLKVPRRVPAGFTATLSPPRFSFRLACALTARGINRKQAHISSAQVVQSRSTVSLVKVAENVGLRQRLQDSGSNFLSSEFQYRL